MHIFINSPIKHLVSKTNYLCAFSLICASASFGQISFGPEVIINPNADNARWVDVIDMDGDGDMDVLSASQNDDRIAWYENDGAQNFTQFDITTTLDLATGVEAGDMDGDGDIDVVASSFTTSTGRVSWFKNDGAQNFTQIDIELNLNKVHSIAMNDIDNDGDLDVLAPVRNEDRIILYTNDGSGNFTASNVVIGAMCNSPRTVWVEDIDGDGDKDVLHYAMLSNAVYWNENDGAQNFTTHVVNSGNHGNSKFVSAGDMDGDGDMDILSASPSTDRLVLHRNNGSQVFTDETISNTNINPFCIVPVDLDFDGDLDLLTAIKGEHHFAWYVNDGTGSFGPKNIISGASTCLGATYIMPEDLDGDGDIDAIVSAEGDDDVSWFVPTILLPVEDLQFQGQQLERRIDLFWTTQSEINNDYFNVERSIDGQAFEYIGSVDGAGNTIDQTQYALTDSSPNLGMNYYRLRQVDYNGDYEYSNVIAFEYNGNRNDQFISVIPNPSNGSSRVLFNSTKKGSSSLIIYNSVGKVIFTESTFAQKGLNVIELNLEDISKGIYHISLQIENEEPMQLKLLIN
jgi:FG-GAP-like repeat/Secretion system C-terminal sorting domain